MHKIRRPFELEDRSTDQPHGMHQSYQKIHKDIETVTEAATNIYMLEINGRNVCKKNVRNVAQYFYFCVSPLINISIYIYIYIYIHLQ